MMRRPVWFSRRSDREHPYWQLAAQRRRAHNASAAFYIDANFYLDAHPASIELGQTAGVDTRHRPEFDRVTNPVARFAPPSFCELLMCLLVEPEFQEDRLADYQERFNGLWVPRFGYRGAVAVYVWHVLRQSRLIDWLIRMFAWGDPL
jgi:hypothetical protein